MPPVSDGQGDPKIFPSSHLYATSSLVLTAGAGTMTNNIQTQHMNVQILGSFFHLNVCQVISAAD